MRRSFELPPLQLDLQGGSPRPASSARACLRGAIRPTPAPACPRSESSARGTVS